MASGIKRKTSHSKSSMIAFTGMVTAVSAILMLSGSIIPAATFIAPLIAGILLLPVMLEFGKKAAWITWLATVFIAMIISYDREAAFFYLFFAYWPLIKWPIDQRLKKQWLRFLCKFLYFLLLGVLMYGLLALVFRVDALLSDFAEMGQWMTAVFLLCIPVCMLLYDFMMEPLLLIYVNRIRPKLRFLYK